MTTSETYNRHTYYERRFLRLRRRGRGDASFDDAATGEEGGTGGGLSNNRKASPDIAVKAVDESQKRWKPLGNENVIGIVAISASWPIFLATPARDALPGGAASWRSKLA